MILTIKQSEAIDILSDNVTNELLFGGGAGGGKSRLGAYWIVKNCIQYPETRWLVGRTILKTLKETTLFSIYDVLKDQQLQKDIHYTINFGRNTINFWNGSQIILKDLFQYPSDPNFDELGSLEITGAFIDEANQVSEKCKEILKSRIRYRLDENGLIPKVLYTCNPAKNWTYQQFFKPSRDNTLPPNRKFLQALANDNEYISRFYISNLSTLDKVSRERLLYGNWEYDDDLAKLIEYDNILNIFENQTAEVGRMYITADIARFGKDRTIIILWNGLQVVRYIALNQSSVVETAESIKALANEFSIPLLNIIVDEDGIGGGCKDILKCSGFVNNSRALNNENFINLKSQCYYKLAEYINSNRISWLDITIQDKEMLIQELEQVKQKDVDKDGRKAVVPKERIKEFIGRSPDMSDAMMLRMFYELKPPTTIKTKKY
jgi:phage terminase large subunit